MISIEIYEVIKSKHSGINVPVCTNLLDNSLIYLPG